MGCDYEVVWPLGKSAYSAVGLAARVSDLNGKTICELSDWLFKADEIFPMVRESLSKQYPDVKFVDYNVAGDIHGEKEAEIIANLPDLLREYNCDAVIAGIGA